MSRDERNHLQEQKRLKPSEKDEPGLGDIYLFTALDVDTKLLITYALGKRNSEVANAFASDLSSRIVRPPQTGPDSPQISTDGFASYYAAIRGAFGQTAKHGVLIKSYENLEVGRYAPPELHNARRLKRRPSGTRIATSSSVMRASDGFRRRTALLTRSARRAV